MNEKSAARIDDVGNARALTMRAWALLLVAGALSMSGRAAAIAAENRVIDLTYVSVMDMVRPDVHPGIVVHHNLQITVSKDNELSESRDRSTRSLYDQNSMVQVLGSSGEGSTYASWSVAPDGRLVRIQNDPQSTRTMTVTLMPGDTCRLDVADQLKPGFSEYAFIRISSHRIGYFSSYRVISTTCTIH